MLDLKFNARENIYSKIDEYNKKVYIWGVGSVAAGVKRELDSKSIAINGFFTNVNDYNLDPRLEGENVYLLDELLKSKEKFSVVVGHSHYELAKTLLKHENIENVWTLAMIVRPDISMSREYIIDNIAELKDTYYKLADETSRQNMVDYLNVQLTRSGQSIIDNFKTGCTYFNNDILSLTDFEEYLDIGAYDGSSIDEFIKVTNSGFRSITGLEVMKNQYEYLCKKYNDKRIKIINTGISDHEGYDYFNFNDQSTALSDQYNGAKVPVSTIDNVCKEYDVNPSILKMCIGNTILPILDGSSNTLENLPSMIITAGIDTEALIKYIPKIEKMVGEDRYNFYLRYTSAMAECLIYIIKPKKVLKKVKTLNL